MFWQLFVFVCNLHEFGSSVRAVHSSRGSTHFVSECFLVGSLIDIVIPSTKRLLLHLKVVLVEVSTFHTSASF